MMKLINLGVHQDMLPYLQQKAQGNNRVAFMCAIIGFVYAPFIYVHYPKLVVYPGLLAIVSVGILLLNSQGWHYITRPINCVQMITLATLFHASIIQENDTFLISFFCTQLAMTLIPWIIYSYQEWRLLAGTLIICYGLLISQQWLNSHIEVPVDVTFFKESYLNPMTYTSAIIIELCCIGFIMVERTLSFFVQKEKVAFVG